MKTGRMSAAIGVSEEIEFLDSSKEKLRRKHRGRYVLIRGRAVLGNFETEEAAYQGVAQCGMAPFVVAYLGEHGDRAWVPRLVELGSPDPAGEEEFIPSHSWRRGKFVDNPIVELDIPPPKGDGGD
jgi:hypothetical protein